MYLIVRCRQNTKIHHQSYSNERRWENHRQCVHFSEVTPKTILHENCKREIANTSVYLGYNGCRLSHTLHILCIFQSLQDCIVRCYLRQTTKAPNVHKRVPLQSGVWQYALTIHRKQSLVFREIFSRQIFIIIPLIAKYGKRRALGNVNHFGSLTFWHGKPGNV